MFLRDFLPNYEAEFMIKKAMKGLSNLAEGMSKQAPKIKKKKIYQGNKFQSTRVGESASKARAGAQGLGGKGGLNIGKGKGGGKYAGQSFRY